MSTEIAVMLFSSCEILTYPMFAGLPLCTVFCFAPSDVQISFSLMFLSIAHAVLQVASCQDKEHREDGVLWH